MLFPTVDFALFFVVVFTLNWLLRPYHTAWRVFMLVASFFFYGYFEWKYLPLLGGSMFFNWLFGQAAIAALDRDGQKTLRSRRIVGLAVVLNIGLLAIFKYFDFFTSSVSGNINRLGLDVDPPLLNWLLPIGISFFTFQALSYVIDAGRGNIKTMSLLDFGVYLSFFPHLVAGPIVRATEFAPQIIHKPDPRHVHSAEAFRLIGAGLFKKVVIANFLGVELVDPVFGNPDAYSAPQILGAVYGYAIQIYADFSGYTDIAIGVALLLGIRFPQNFNAPYISTSVQEFWRRWHMTLSRWLRDYLYIPLGGNRLGERRTSINLMATMLLGGLWHGASWNFVIWGGIHGGALIGERRVKEWWEPRSLGLPLGLVRSLQWLLTFHIVCLAWIFFRAPDMEIAGKVLGGLATGIGATGLSGLPLAIGFIIVVLAIGSQFVPQKFVVRFQDEFSLTPVWIQGVVLAVGLTVIDALGPEGVAPFIYFQF